jgi:hypothetical protein
VRRLGSALAVALAVSGVAVGCTGVIDAGGNRPGGSQNNGPGGSQDPGGGNPPGGNGSQPGGNGSMGPGGNGSMPGDPPAPPSAEVKCTNDGKDSVGRRTLRRLTNAELEATIRSAFGLDATKWTGLTVPPDPGSKDGFTNNVDQLSVSPDYARGAQETGRKVASLVSEGMLAGLLPCAAAGDRACADSFVSTYGAKLFRRPLTPAEKARYLALYDKAGQPADFKGFVYWATATMLQSPNVIYRTELGEPDGKGRFKLTPYEVASSLSYTFTGGPPDAPLMALAAAGKLGTADEVEAAARGLILDGQTVRPAFREVIMRFADQWMGLASLSNLKKDDMAFPDFKGDIQEALGEETRRFIAGVMLEGRGKVADVLTAPYTFVDARLAKYYGFTVPAGATGFQRVDRPANWGVGLLAQGSLLAVKAHSLNTSPTKRGHLVRSSLMCGEVPPPPPVVAELPEPTDAETTRKRYEVLHAADAGCNACHRLMDPIGFAFEHFDATGRYRAKEGTFDIDDSGYVQASSQGDLRVQGAAELAAALARLPEVTECWASHAAAFAFGLSREGAACLAASATKDLQGGLSLLDFYVRLARAEHFRTRQP